MPHTENNTQKLHTRKMQHKNIVQKYNTKNRKILLDKLNSKVPYAGNITIIFHTWKIQYKKYNTKIAHAKIKTKILATTMTSNRNREPAWHEVGFLGGWEKCQAVIYLTLNYCKHPIQLLNPKP